MEEKYKKAMVSNAQLDNEKTNFMYQVDTLKDALLELEEELAEARRQCEEKSKVGARCQESWAVQGSVCVSRSPGAQEARTPGQGCRGPCKDSFPKAAVEFCAEGRHSHGKARALG